MQSFKSHINRIAQPDSLPLGVQDIPDDKTTQRLVLRIRKESLSQQAPTTQRIMSTGLCLRLNQAAELGCTAKAGGWGQPSDPSDQPGKVLWKRWDFIKFLRKGEEIPSL